jgi:hypothetical protein
LQALIAETGPVTERLRVREIDDDEGQRLVRIIRRGSGSVVTWRHAQMVLLSARGMVVPAIAKAAFTSEDRVRPRIRATCTRTVGVRHLFAACELGEDKLFGHIKPRKTRALICDNFSPHLSTRRDRRVGIWAQANNVEIAYTPTNSSWLNRPSRDPYRSRRRNAMAFAR